MSERTGRVIDLNGSFAVILPKDWCRGNRIGKGTVVRIIYNGRISVIAPMRESSVEVTR